MGAPLTLKIRQLIQRQKDTTSRRPEAVGVTDSRFSGIFDENGNPLDLKKSTGKNVRFKTPKDGFFYVGVDSASGTSGLYEVNAKLKGAGNEISTTGKKIFKKRSIYQGIDGAKSKVKASNFNDILINGNGKHTLTGKKGSDLFVFSNLDVMTKKRADIITDFNSNDGDKIIINDNAFPGLRAESPYLSLSVVSSKSDSNRYKPPMFVYEQAKKTGRLYFNANSSAPGLGER